MLLLDIVFLELSQQRLPPLEQLALVAKDFVAAMADIALMVDSQMLLETMGLFVPRAGPRAPPEGYAPGGVPMAGHQLFVEEMDLVVALDH